MATTILTTCNSTIEANLIKGMLENNGVNCFLTNENFTTLMPQYNGMLGAGVQIIIDKADLEKAQKLLSKESNAKEIVCPECNSTNVKFGIGKSNINKIALVLLSIFFWIPFGNIRRNYYCKDCKNDFKI